MATAQDTRIDQLTERVERLEADVQALRAADQRNPATELWADMEMLRQEMRQVLDFLGIQHRSVDILDLQHRLGAKFERNEFSRSIIEARDE